MKGDNVMDSKSGIMKHKKKINSEFVFSFTYLAPFLLIFATFTILPVIISIFFSFTYYNVLEAPQWVFLQNYLKLFLNDDIFLISLKNTMIIAVIVGPVGYAMSLVFAWFINELGENLRAIFVLIFYAPSISGGVYAIWSIIFSGDAFGYANSLLLYLGFVKEPIQWLTDKDYMLWLVIIVMLWMSLGSGFLSFVAGLRTIDRSYYEVGYIEGIKNRWQELWYVTLPCLRPQMMFGAVMSITAAFTSGDVTVALCGSPSTDYGAHTILNHLTDYGTTRFDMGYACTIATVLFVIMVFVNEVIQRAISKIGN